MLQCDECDYWQLLYSQKKWCHQERKNIEVALADYSFTCGSPLQDLDLTGKLAYVYVEDLSCGHPVRSYATLLSTPPFEFTVQLLSSRIPKMLTTPQCKDCSDKPHINYTGALSPGSRPFAGCQWTSLAINLMSSVHARAVKQVVPS